jgi:hypothetical protein
MIKNLIKTTALLLFLHYITGVIISADFSLKNWEAQIREQIGVIFITSNLIAYFVVAWASDITKKIYND